MAASAEFRLFHIDSAHLRDPESTLPIPTTVTHIEKQIPLSEDEARAKFNEDWDKRYHAIKTRAGIGTSESVAIKPVSETKSVQQTELVL